MLYRTAERIAKRIREPLKDESDIQKILSSDELWTNVHNMKMTPAGLSRLGRYLRKTFGSSILAAERPVWSKGQRVLRLRLVIRSRIHIRRTGETCYQEPCILFKEVAFIFVKGQGWCLYSITNTGSVGIHALSRFFERTQPPTGWRPLEVHAAIQTGLKKGRGLVDLLSRQLWDASAALTRQKNLAQVQNADPWRIIYLPVEGGVFIGHLSDSVPESGTRYLNHDDARIDLRTYIASDKLTVSQEICYILASRLINAQTRLRLENPVGIYRDQALFSDELLEAIKAHDENERHIRKTLEIGSLHSINRISAEEFEESLNPSSEGEVRTLPGPVQHDAVSREACV